MVGSGDLVSALVVHYAMQLYVLHTAMYWADTCQVAEVQLTVGVRRNKYAYQLVQTKMYPCCQNFAQIHPETQTGAEILSCEACTGREAASTRQNMFATRCSSRKCSFHHNLSGHATQMGSIEGYKHSGRLLAGSHYHTSCYRLYSRGSATNYR